jgi:hypothetical protein
MWKPFGPMVGCGLAAVPLLGFVGGYTALAPRAGPPPAAVAATIP